MAQGGVWPDDSAGRQRWRTVEGGITAARATRDDVLGRKGRGELVQPNPRDVEATWKRQTTANVSRLPSQSARRADLARLGDKRQQTAAARAPFASRRSPVRSRLAPLTDFLQARAFARSRRPGAVGTRASGRCGSRAGREAPEAPLMPSSSIIPTACAVSLLSQRAALRILPRRSRMPCTSSHRAGSVDGKTRPPSLPSKQGL